MLPQQGGQVGSLVRDLRSRMPCGMAKERKKESEREEGKKEGRKERRKEGRKQVATSS